MFYTERRDKTSQAVLAPVGFVRHDHNVPPGGQRLSAFIKLLHSDKDNAVYLGSQKVWFFSLYRDE